MKAALLADRGVILVSGPDARKFLNGLVTADVTAVTPERPAFAALLTPQGKIIADFIIAQAAEDAGFALDCPRALVDALADRLSFYKLRAKVRIEAQPEAAVVALWEGRPSADAPGIHYPDPRLPALGHRLIVPTTEAEAAARALGAEIVDASVYESHRIGLGVPRGGADFSYGEAFPHEADMDQLHGVSFDKGCYIGQEVVSRVQHRGMARTRIMPVLLQDFGPEPGMPITAGKTPIGTMGSTAQGRGLAMVRLDRAAEALAQGVPLVAGGVEVRLDKPAWSTFPWPPAAAASG